MNARAESTDSWWWKVFFTPVGPRLVVGRQWPFRHSKSRWLSASELISASDLPAPIREIITAVVKRTRLWRSERADVARELVAHFSDAIAQGAGADDAARAFGDVRRAARLIRRSKRRNRPLAWQTWHRSAQGVGMVFLALVALYAVLIVRYYSGAPRITHDYLAEINASILALPQDECGWPVYQQALQALDAPAPKGPGEHLILAPDDEGWPAMADYLKEHAAALELARMAAARPHLGIPLVRQSDADEAPIMWNWSCDVLEVRPLARLLLADARLAALEGDANRVQADLFALIDAATQFRESPLFIGDVLSFYLLVSVAHVIDDILIESPDLFDDAQLIGLAHSLGTYSGGGSIRVRFETNQVFFDEMMQRLYTDDGHGDGRLTNEGMDILSGIGLEVPVMAPGGAVEALNWFKAPLAAQAIGSRREITEEFERQLSRIASEAAEPMWKWTMVPGGAFEQLVATPSYYRKYTPLFVLLSAIGWTATQAEIAVQRRDATLTAIAIELYRRQHGDYPRTLSELVPTLLPSVPVDRFDGQPLRYRVDESGPLLYSVGSDRVDGGGAEPTSEFERQYVSRYLWKMPNAPMHADWILWDGRRQSAADEP